MTRFLAVVLLVLAVALVPSAARADTITVADITSPAAFAVNATYGSGTGGPWTATTTGTLLSNSPFMTFCLELNEYLTLGTTYDFTLSNSAVNGGLGGGSPDPLSDATKWLYYQALFNPSGSWYAASGAVGVDEGAAIQYAIWGLEDEMTLSSGSDGYKVAQYAIANQNWASLEAQGNHVWALNLTSGTPGINLEQDQSLLGYTHTPVVPEPGSLLLLGTGLIGAARAWRKRRG